MEKFDSYIRILTILLVVSFATTEGTKNIREYEIGGSMESQLCGR